MEDFVQKTDQGRVLFTGNGDYLIQNIIDHISNLYTLSTCPPEESKFMETLCRFQPHALVICLLNETQDTIRAYRLLESDPRFQHLPTIVIGKDDECDSFIHRVKITNVAVFTRPVDVSRILEMLSNQVAISKDAEKTASAAAALPFVSVGGPSIDKVWKEEDIMQNTKNAAPLPGNRQSILVVDDDVRMLNTIKLFLEDLYDVTVVPNGKLALKFLEKKHADLVLLDYMMPELDGPEVLKFIRQNPKTAEIPVLFLTGVADRDQVMRGISLHPNGYLLKPIDRETLIERVMSTLLGL